MNDGHHVNVNCLSLIKQLTMEVYVEWAYSWHLRYVEMISFKFRLLYLQGPPPPTSNSWIEVSLESLENKNTTLLPLRQREPR
jgi:hypothetical protein